MTSPTLSYRGVRYDASSHTQPDKADVEHVYRGHHYRSSLRHEAAPVDESVTLQYRGQRYHHHAAAGKA
ncbi:DUF4278 domain-containing protein [Synechococcus sp. RSCCF101]|uniref:DUF4278 domain-containing protein n=1 Tax=Synechococcus sp. RSCCF101 TaxID=2511069 RepID=UPI0012442EA8|nr:DUF4278 domain-containing protein [Synechococcus sp. RSCCF101]QEY33112.1 DUF4278 domain-containing protein [Synechococcus sp. RSCCF101]